MATVDCGKSGSMASITSTSTASVVCRVSSRLRISRVTDQMSLLGMIEPYLHTYRVYGQPKIKKPKELKGLKPKFKVSQGDCKSAKRDDVYVVGNDVWVYFADLFSRYATFPDVGDMTLPTAAIAAKYNLDRKRFKTFVYADGWCRIFNRNEGYVVFPNLIWEMRRTRYVPELIYDVCDAFMRLSETDRGFCRCGMDVLDERTATYERVISEMVYKFVKEDRGYE